MYTDFAEGLQCCLGDLLITKNIRRLQTLYSLHTEVPNINNLGKLLSLKQQLKALQMDGVLAQFWHRCLG
jgi:hypothetical protein